MQQTQYMVWSSQADHRIMADSDSEAVAQAQAWARDQLEAEMDELVDGPITQTLEWTLETAVDGRRVADSLVRVEHGGNRLPTFSERYPRRYQGPDTAGRFTSS